MLTSTFASVVMVTRAAPVKLVYIRIILFSEAGLGSYSGGYWVRSEEGRLSFYQLWEFVGFAPENF